MLHPLKSVVSALHICVCFNGASKYIIRFILRKEEIAIMWQLHSWRFSIHRYHRSSDVAATNKLWVRQTPLMLFTKIFVSPCVPKETLELRSNMSGNVPTCLATFQHVWQPYGFMKYLLKKDNNRAGDGSLQVRTWGRTPLKEKELLDMIIENDSE